MSVKVKRSNPKFAMELLNKYTKMRKIEIAVGFPVGTKGSRKHNQADIEIYRLAAIHQFGSVTRGIPARDFMGDAKIPTIHAITPLVFDLTKRINKGGEPHLNGFKRIALVAEAEMKIATRNLTTPGNASSTIKQKGSSNPLIDTGEMLNSVTAVVRKSTT